MSVEIPSALIRRIQATLRKNAGVPSSYDPADPSLSSVPSLNDAISALDADPSLSSPSSSSYPRCSKCRRGAGLVRGAQSTLCIFCGRDRGKDGVAQSISFTSTVACKKLLESLQLDGSEVINLDTESNDSNKGQDTQQDGLTLSTVLEFKLKWPPEKEEAFNRSSDKALVSYQAANLSGVDLDTYFSDSINKRVSGASSVTSEELMPSKQTISTKSRGSSVSENFSSFKYIQTPNMAVTLESTQGGADFADSFADWEAGFQSASSQAFHSESGSIDHYHSSSIAGSASLATDVAVAVEYKSVDLFEGSTAEVSSHATPASTFSQDMNMEHEMSNGGNSREASNEWGQFSSSGNWIQDDLWPNPADQLENTSKTDGNELKYDVQCLTSTGDNWDQDEMWATSSMKPSNIKSNHGDDNDAFDDALDSWQDFTSSKEATGVLSSSWMPSGNEITSNEHDSVLKPLDLQDMEFGNFLQSDSSPSGAFGKQGGPSKVNDFLLHTSASASDIDKCLNVKSINANSLEAQQDVTSQNGALGDFSNLWTQTNEHASGTKSLDPQDVKFGSFLHSDSFSGALGGEKDASEGSSVKLSAPVSSNILSEFDKTRQSDNDDCLDDWQDFTSSKGTPVVMPNSFTFGAGATSTDYAPGVKPVNTQDSEFGSFVYSDFFSGVDSQKGSIHVNNIHLDALASKSNTEFKSDNNMNNNDGLFEPWKDFTSSNVLPESLSNLSRQIGNDDSSNNINDFDKTKHTDDNDDSLDDWQDFTSSKEAPSILPTSFTSSSEATSMEHAPGVKSVDPLEPEFGSFVSSDFFSGMDGQKGSADVNGIHLDALVSHSSTEFKSDYNMNDNDDLFSSWKEITNSNEVPECLSNVSKQTSAEATSYEHTSGMKSVDLQDMEFGDFLQSDVFSGVSRQGDSSKANDIQLDTLVSTSSKKEFNNKDMDDSDDPFEAWQEFISPNDAQGSLANLSTEPDTKATSYVHASGKKSLALRDMGFGSLLRSDSLSGASGGVRGSSELNDMQAASISYRLNGIGEDSMIPGATDAHENNIYAPNSESSNLKVEMLLAKMPNLSFMLEDTLSIPKKVDSSNLKS